MKILKKWWIWAIIIMIIIILIAVNSGAFHNGFNAAMN